MTNLERPPQTSHTRWYGAAYTCDQELMVKAIMVTAHNHFAETGRAPCAVRVGEWDAYDLASHYAFCASHGAGQVLGSFCGMVVILDPDLGAGKAKLEVCSGCLSFPAACYYQTPVAAVDGA